MGEEWGGPFFRIQVLRPEFLSCSLAEMPMSYKQRWGMAGEGPSNTFHRALSPNSHSHRPTQPMEGRGRWFSESGNHLPWANSAQKGGTERVNHRRGSPSEGLLLWFLTILPDRRTRRCAEWNGARFSIGCRSLGSAPIENLRAFLASGRPPTSIGRVERAERRTPTKRCAKLGRGARGADNWL